jgi:peptidoglycan-associated lipoprotein
MKKLLTMILIGLFLAGCAKKQVEQAVIEEPPVEEAPVVAEVEPEPVVLAVVEEPPVPRGADKIYFDLNSHELTAASKKELENNALWIKSQDQVRVSIEGHADERGSDQYNAALGKKRAQAARDYLVNLGVSPDRITIVSHGKKMATKGANSESVWAMDRRAEFVMAD